MPLVTDSLDFSHLDALDIAGLHARYRELEAGLKKLPDGRPDPNATEDDAALNEICVILANLRKKTAGPPRKRPAPGTRAKAPVVETSLEDL